MTEGGRGKTQPFPLQSRSRSQEPTQTHSTYGYHVHYGLKGAKKMSKMLGNEMRSKYLWGCS